MQTNEMNQLRQDLNQFGLDPRDWRLVREGAQLIRIEAVDDGHFTFLGRVFKKGSKLTWKQIQLMEI